MESLTETLIEAGNRHIAGKPSIIFDSSHYHGLFFAIFHRQSDRDYQNALPERDRKPEQIRHTPCDCKGKCAYLAEQVKSGRLAPVQAADYNFWVCDNISDYCDEKQGEQKWD